MYIHFDLTVSLSLSLENLLFFEKIVYVQSVACLQFQPIFLVQLLVGNSFWPQLYASLAKFGRLFPILIGKRKFKRMSFLILREQEMVDGIAAFLRLQH